MSEDKVNVPKIRFPGFTNAWEQHKLGDLCNKFRSGEFIKASDISPLGEYPVYGGNGIRGYTNKYNHDGEFALIGRQGALCGNMQYSCGKAYFTEHAVAVSANYENETRFLYYLFGKMNLGQYSGQSAQPGLAVGKLIELKTMVPIKAEQSKISVLFSKLDHLIALHQRKLNNVKNLKAGLLQKMFSKDGEDFPEVRFPGFTDAWEQRRFDSMFDPLPSNTLSRADLNYDDGKIKNVHYGDILIKYGAVTDCCKDVIPFITGAEVSDYQSHLLQNGDVLFADAAEDTTVGKATEIAGITSIPVVSGLHTIACRPKVNMQPNFLGYYINSPSYRQQLLPIMQGIKVLSISRTNLAKTTICYPTSAQEQSQIGSFFRDLDHLITLHQRKLEHLKEQKKVLLQQMFV
ncbi:restriction endonuclease subunit S [Paenibacillus sp. Marseille-P2973]|uniref:restriction endonuclease subunit S n=1 Tax=Paenibacillus sp. Marseille-P2973 TaxID=1871032 RepID=UPI001B379B60|nr:restriction endonuclease subunit S [Paenibacillus sp. Marseille-P2973]MBQ4900307.1 restriction endonuclease subunit S [Paenibacillus sp. Marseille-P2973]